MCNNTHNMYIRQGAGLVGHRQHTYSHDMKYLIVISSVATLLQLAAGNYLPSACAYNCGGPLVLPAPGCGCCSGCAPTNVGPLLGAIAPALPLLAPALSNTISDAIVASLPPLLDAALPTVLNSVLTAAGPLLEAAVPCGCGASYSLNAPLGLGAPCTCSYASPLIPPPMYACPCTPTCLW